MLNKLKFNSFFNIFNFLSGCRNSRYKWSKTCDEFSTSPANVDYKAYASVGISHETFIWSSAILASTGTKKKTTKQNLQYLNIT